MSAAVVRLTAWQLVRMNRNASCCDCGSEPGEISEEELWIIWQGRFIYCRRCAAGEGVIDG